MDINDIEHLYECDYIINAVMDMKYIPIHKLSILQESYINAELEKKFDIEMPFIHPKYFSNTMEIIDHLCLK